MSPFLDALLVLKGSSYAAILLCVAIVWSGAVSAGAVRLLLRRDPGIDDLLSIAAGAWVLPAILTSTVALLVSPHNGVAVVILAVAGGAVLASAWRAKQKHATTGSAVPGSLGAVAALAVLLVWLVPLRLAFLKGILLPTYFDSAAHYGLIQQILQKFSLVAAPRSLALPAPGYYHIGYHILLAGLVSLFRLDVAEAMLLSGQFVLVLLPLTIYAVVHTLSNSRVAGVVASVLAAIGWYMPAHAVNWGKYPALFGLLVLLSTLGFLAVTSLEDLPPWQRRRVVVLAGLTSVVALLIHTRTILVLAIAVLAWLLAGRVMALGDRRRHIAIVILVAVLAALTAYLSTDSVLAGVLDPYVGIGSSMTVLVGVLAVFAYRYRPRILICSILVLAGLFSAMLVSVPFVGGSTLLDRPYVEMLLSPLLSIVGGVGLAGLISDWPSDRLHLRAVAGAIILLAVTFHAVARYEFGPSRCCSVVGPDDVVALDWLRQHAPAGARVVMASTQLRVAPGNMQSLVAPSDAGAWIQPLTGLETVRVPSDADFSNVAVLDRVCVAAGRPAFLYVTDSTQGFNVETILTRPAWYQPRLQLPGASIFEVINCG